MLIKYLRYLIHAKNEHSAHSPFLYKFITRVLNQASKNDNCADIESLRKKLSKSKKVIKITDFGAGSRVNKSRKRKVKNIAKYSAKNKKFGELLYRIVQFYNPKTIIELGTSLGISTLYLAKGDSKSKIYTLEGCPETIDLAKQNFKEMNIQNVIPILGDFNNTLEKTLKKEQKIDLIFVDGNHQQEATISYFETCLKYTHNNTILIFDDIYWSKGMEEAWKHIKLHEKTTLTIDLFYIGIVFIKSELSKENYIIKF